MVELIHEHATRIRTPAGEHFIARTFAAPQPDGTWVGWLEFEPEAGEGPKLATERETRQPNIDAMVYWASGLEAVYIEGAFERAKIVASR